MNADIAIETPVPKRGKRRASTAVTHVKRDADGTDYVEQLDRLRRQGKVGGSSCFIMFYLFPSCSILV
jgi:hypothetical protein